MSRFGFIKRKRRYPVKEALINPSRLYQRFKEPALPLAPP